MLNFILKKDPTEKKNRNKSFSPSQIWSYNMENIVFESFFWAQLGYSKFCILQIKTFSLIIFKFTLNYISD